MKVCSTCKEEKEIIFFRKVKLSGDKYKSQCKACENLYRIKRQSELLPIRLERSEKGKEERQKKIIEKLKDEFINVEYGSYNSNIIRKNCR